MNMLIRSYKSSQLVELSDVIKELVDNNQLLVPVRLPKIKDMTTIVLFQGLIKYLNNPVTLELQDIRNHRSEVFWDIDSWKREFSGANLARVSTVNPSHTNIFVHFSDVFISEDVSQVFLVTDIPVSNENPHYMYTLMGFFVPRMFVKASEEHKRIEDCSIFAVDYVLGTLPELPEEIAKQWDDMTAKYCTFPRSKKAREKKQ